MSSLLTQLERRAPALGDRVARANWRLRNRSRAYDGSEVPAQLQPLVEQLRRDGVLITDERRSEEHTSELQSRPHLVCRLLLEKKKKQNQRKNNSRLNDNRKQQQQRIETNVKFLH